MRDENGKWINPNKLSDRERMDHYLESQGLLNYQTRGMSAGDIQQRYQNAGVRLADNSQWGRQNYGDNFENQFRYPQVQVSNINGASADAARMTGLANLYRGGAQVNPANIKGPAQDPNAQTMLDPMGRPVTISGRAQQVIQNQATRAQQRAQADANNKFVIGATTEQVQKGEANWTDISSWDRKQILQDPNFYKGDIAKYSAAQQQQILADPSFNWDNVPKWQRTFYQASSNPAGMGALQGLVMGAGNPGGALTGAAMGWAATVLGYDPTKEFWKQGNDKITFDKEQAMEIGRGAFGFLNWAAENVEKSVGFGIQAIGTFANKETGTLSDLWKNRKAAFDAGAITYDLLGPYVTDVPRMYAEAIEKTTKEGIPFNEAVAQVLNSRDGQILQTVIGSNMPVAQGHGDLFTALNWAKNEIDKGANYREIMTELQTGVEAQISDMALQGMADPLNLTGEVQAKAGEITARIQGDKIAEAAFKQSLAGDKPGYQDAKARLKNTINTPGEAAKIDPNFKIDEMGWMTQRMSGLTKDGQIKGGMFESAGGLLDNKPREKNLKGFIQSLTDYTPEARARIGQDMLVGNVGKIMASYFNGTDVEGFGKWWRSFQQGDMTQAADLSAAVMNAPEFYTTLPAAKGFDIDSRLATWQQTDSARQMVRNMADTLGENPITFIENMAKQGTAEQDFIRLTERLKALDTPEAKAMLKDIADGRLTVDILADSVKMFGKGDVAFHPGQWMAETLNGIQEHYDTWAIDHFKLEEDSRKTLFRVSSVLKSMQSVLLLGANPGYMISNVLPTMVTRAIDGVWGYMTPTAIDDFMTRMGFDIDKGFSPSRLEEGVGPGGLVDQARSAGDPIRNATRGKGILTSVEDALGKIGRNMPFNKLSRVMEGYEGKQAYAIGIKKFMGEGWRRGKGFKTVPAELAAELSKVAGPRAADILHSAIEAGLTQQEIKNIVSTASGNMQSRALIHEAAQSMNVETSKAASMLEQAGVLDALDNALKGANTEGRIERAFKQAKQTAKQKLDEQAVRDNTATIEHVANRLQTEGMKAITDIVLDTESQGIEQWLQHYERMGEVADAMDSIDNADVRSRLWSLKYSESSAEFRRYNAQKAATYMGVLKATGLDNNPTGRGLLSTMAETDQALDNAYRTMRQLRDEHFQKWNSDWDNPRRQVERNQIDKQIEKVWADATRKELQNSAKFGELLATQYEQLYGIEAGEMARQAWEQITAFRKEMTTRRDAFRKSIEGMPYAARQIESKKFWGETYKYAIVEMERVKTEAINELDRIARGGGGQPQQQNGPLPTEPPAGYKPDEWAELRKAAEERQAAREAKINGIWEVAAEYGYTREDTRGLYGLLGALSKEEYGGDPTFTGGMKEASDRFTPEQVTDILEKRRTAKTFEEEQRQAARNVEYQRKMEEAKAKAEKKMPHDILASIITFGGIDWQHVKDITGEKNPPANQKKIFSKTGKNRWALDEMARVLADDGFSIDLNDPNDTGGLRQVTDLIQRAFRGEKIYNMEGADKANALNEKALAKAEAEFYADRAAEDEFNTSRWEVDMMDATERMDFAKLADLIEQLPADLAEQQFSITGETYGQYVSRAWDETSARQATEAQDVAIAEGMTRSADALTAQENAATAGYTRQKFQESLTSVFGLPEDQVSAFMEVADGVSRWYENATGENADQFYSRYYGDIAKAGDDAIEGLFQQNYPRIDVSNRKMTQADAENYARMLVRAGERELRAAIRNEGNKADRVAILQAAHEINPDMAESVARSSVDVLFQEAWHGSPHKFGQFDLSYLGTGEGAQAYGWGLYFTDTRGIAEGYREALSPRAKGTPAHNTINGERITLKVAQDISRGNDAVAELFQNLAVQNSIANNKDITPLIDGRIKLYTEAMNRYLNLENDLRGRTDVIYSTYSADDYNRFANNYKNSINNLEEFKRGLEYKPREEGKQNGQLYRVDIPGDNYLLWDRPLSEQPEAVKDAVKRLTRDTGEYLSLEDALSGQAENIQNAVKAAAERIVSEATNKLGYKEASVMSRYLDNYDWSKTGAEIYNDLVSVAGSESNVLSALNIEGVTLKEKLLSEKSTGSDIYEMINSDPKTASLALKEAGINGIKYLDGSSRRAGEGSYNYVVFDDEAIKIMETYYQRQNETPAMLPPNAAVTFDGIKASMKVWETADITTVIHENAHIYRRVMEDVVLRTGNERIRADLNTIEEWAGVKEGAWTRDAEEKFARGFERYMTSGEAPTPKLRAAFQKIKEWMLGIYRSITGSPIDINITPEVRAVFDRMVAGSEGTPEKKAGFTDEFDNNLAKVKEAHPTRPVEKVDTRLTVDPNKQPFELTFEEFKVRALEEQNALAQNNSKTLSADRYGNIREAYNSVIEKALIDGQPVPEDVKQAYYQDKKQPLFQQQPAPNPFADADPRMPLGGYEEAAQWKPEGQAMDEIWTQEISPLLDKMEETAKRRLTEPGLDGAYKDMSPEGQKMLQQYLKGVQNDLASTKMAAIRWGEQKRDTAMLNYNKRYGADRYLDVIFPYQFFYTRSMITWAKRAADNPALLANYARLRRQQDRYKNNLPERLRGKMRIEAPWMPDWMGDALYIDPLSVLFTPHAFMRPMEQMVKDQNYQTIEAERILQEWAADGSVSQDQITQAARDRSGATWERAMAESKMRREAEISNPMDFMATMLGPAWYLTTPAKLLSLGKDGPNTLTELPLTRTARAFENVTKDTWAEPAGKLIGMLAKPEEALRKKLNIPEYGEYGDYYTDRAIANMVAEGKITSEDATIAMIERKGAIFDEAKSRVELELAMRVPLAGAIYASTHGQNALDGMMEGLKALPASLFGSGLLPEGELEYRGLKQEWNEAWKLKDAGDAGAINRFFDDHPEYEAYLAKGKQPDDRLKSFLVGQIWDGYMALGTTDRKTATAEMGDLFKQAFLDSETRSYDTLDVETLTQWAQMLNKRVPTTPQTLPAIEAPRKIDFYAPEVTAVTDQYFEQRSRLYPDYYQTQSEYYNLPKSERRSFLVQHPELAEYWDWNRGWKQRYPELEPIFTGKVFKRVDTSNWNPMLVEYVADYAYSGEQLPKGAWKALEQEWIKAGQPGGSLQSWIDSTVAPAMLYQP